MQMMEPRPREAKQLARGGTAGETRSWDLNPAADSIWEANLRGESEAGSPDRTAVA